MEKDPSTTERTKEQGNQPVCVNEVKIATDKLPMQQAESLSRVENGDANVQIQSLAYFLDLNLHGKLHIAKSMGDVATELIRYKVIDYLPCLGDIRKETHLDMGAKPIILATSHDRTADSIFVVPESQDKRVVVEYASCSAGFIQLGSTELSTLQGWNIKEEEATSTLARAAAMLDPLCGAVVRSDIRFWLWLLAGFVIAVGVGVVLGIYVSYIFIVGTLVLYLVIFGIYAVCLKRRNREILIFAHIALALFARSENTRLYISRNVLIRPGYLGQWLEFAFLKR